MNLPKFQAEIHYQQKLEIDFCGSFMVLEGGLSSQLAEISEALFPKKSTGGQKSVKVVVKKGEGKQFWENCEL